MSWSQSASIACLDLFALIHSSTAIILNNFSCNTQKFYAGTDLSLEDVYNAMTPPMTKDKRHIHDPSQLLATDGLLMIAMTGKENADGYR